MRSNAQTNHHWNETISIYCWLGSTSYSHEILSRTDCKWKVTLYSVVRIVEKFIKGWWLLYLWVGNVSIQSGGNDQVVGEYGKTRAFNNFSSVYINVCVCVLFNLNIYKGKLNRFSIFRFTFMLEIHILCVDEVHEYTTRMAI